MLFTGTSFRGIAEEGRIKHLIGFEFVWLSSLCTLLFGRIAFGHCTAFEHTFIAIRTHSSPRLQDSVDLELFLRCLLARLVLVLALIAALLLVVPVSMQKLQDYVALLGDDWQKRSEDLEYGEEEKFSDSSSSWIFGCF